MNTALEVEEKIANKKHEHIGILDILRGFAASSVLLYHYTSDGGLVKFDSPILNSLFFWGNMGVEVFFVISGFIIPYSLWGTEYKVQDFKLFMAKRIIRIAPPAYICVLLVLAQWVIVDFFIKHGQVSRLEEITFAQVLGNIFFVYPFKDPRWLNGVFWTLSIEFQFYIIVGLLYNKLFNKNVLFLIVGFIVLTAGYYVFDLSKHSLCAYAPLFAMGGITLVYRKKGTSIGLYFAALILFYALAYNTLYPISANFGLVTSLSIAFIRIKSKHFSILGKISYSLYLVHLLVGGTAEFLLSRFFYPKTQFGNIGAILSCVILAYVFAYTYSKVVEVPFMKLAKRFKL